MQISQYTYKIYIKTKILDNTKNTHELFLNFPSFKIHNLTYVVGGEAYHERSIKNVYYMKTLFVGACMCVYMHVFMCLCDIICILYYIILLCLCLYFVFEYIYKDQYDYDNSFIFFLKLKMTFEVLKSFLHRPHIALHNTNTCHCVYIHTIYTYYKFYTYLTKENYRKK